MAHISPLLTFFSFHELSEKNIAFIHQAGKQVYIKIEAKFKKSSYKKLVTEHTCFCST
jgi:hypothetical protein